YRQQGNDHASPARRRCCLDRGVVHTLLPCCNTNCATHRPPSPQGIPRAPGSVRLADTSTPTEGGQERSDAETDQSNSGEPVDGLEKGLGCRSPPAFSGPG